MPDVHFGKGATVGSVIPTKGAIIPAAVGVDIGCGMMAVQTTLRAERSAGSPARAAQRRSSAVPQAATARAAWKDGVPNAVRARASRQRPGRAASRSLEDKHPAIREAQSVTQLGTLGGGNHFIEVCLDEADRVWVMLHSGSRGTGNLIGTYFIARRAKR